MPGVSSRQPVAGAWGFGKVYLRFKPVKKFSIPWGFFVFFALLVANVSIGLWRNVPMAKELILGPSVKNIAIGFDFVRVWLTFYWITYSKNSPKSHFVSSDAYIHRDPISGVAGITAKSTLDAIYSQGYLHAQDRLFQMEMSRRFASGTTSELVGYDSLLDDRIARCMKIYSKAQNDYLFQSEEEKKAIDAYTAGVNAYIAILESVPPLLSFPIELLVLGVFDIKPW